MAGNSFDIQPYEQGNAEYAFAQLACVAPEGNIDKHFPWHFQHDMLARHCVNAAAKNSELSIHMRRLYAALSCISHLKYQPFDYGEVFNQLCFITAALGYPRDTTSSQRYLSPRYLYVGSYKVHGARLLVHGTDYGYLNSLRDHDGENSIHYRIDFKDIQRAAKCGVIVKPKPSDIQAMLKKLAAYLPSTVSYRFGSAKNAQPKILTQTRKGKRPVEYVDADTWAMLVSTVRQLPDRPDCYGEHMNIVRNVYARLHELRSQFATWAFAQPNDFEGTMLRYEDGVMATFRGVRHGSVALNVSPCPPFWQSHTEALSLLAAKLPRIVSLDDALFVH
jgi:hypothetical protein